MTSSVSKPASAVLILCYMQLVMSSDRALASAGDAADCPQTCFCNPLSRIVYCSRRGLDAVPSTLPPNTLQLNVNANHFRSRVLRRVNFSTAHSSNIEHLYLSDCGIERLEVNVFADLTHLRWLDLSDNRLHDIPHRAFYGLTLQHLFLNGNRDIRLMPGSFDGLVTSGLYLHDCALKVLLPEMLSPLNGTLVNLWLNGNRLTGVDERLAPIFSQLSHLRLGANPLHCGCATLWLKQLYDRQGGATFRGAEPPTCWTPDRLRARHFDQLTSADLHCSAPSFGNIDAVLGWRGTGRLRCTATGQPTPVIYWIRPSGRTRRFDVRQQTDAAERQGSDGRNEGKVSIDHAEARSGLYICVAKNDMGNVTLTMNVSWPANSATHTPSSTSQPLSLSDTNKLSVLLRAQSPKLSAIDASTDYELQQAEVDDGRREQLRTAQVMSDVRLFSVAELVAAVVGTHLCTVILFIAVLLTLQLVRAARRVRKRSGATDSQPVCDSLLAKSALQSAHRSTTVHCHRWPAPVDYDVT